MKFLKDLLIGFQNIEKLKDKENDVRDLLRGSCRGVKAPHIYGLAETWGNQNIQDLETHKWFGIDKISRDGLFGGVGAYVSNNLSPFTQILHEFSNENIMWLRIITLEEPLFIAVVYAPPNNTDILNGLITNIINTKSSLSGLGRVLIMGDFNCRLGSTTRDKMVNPRGKLLKDFFKTTKSSPLSNQQDDHWTCYTWNGQSVNDLFIVDNNEKLKCKDYFVFKEHRFSSKHALLTFRWNVKVSPPDKLQWSNHTSTSLNWDDDTINQNYLNLLTPKLTAWLDKNKDMNTVKESNLASNKLVSLIQDCIHQLQTKTKNRQQKYKEFTSDEITQLRNDRNHVISNFTEETSIDTRKEMLSKIHTLQNKISNATELLEKKQTRKLWDKVLENKKGKDMSTYWKMIKRIRSPQEKSFPMAITGPDGSLLITKHEILQAFSNRYSLVFKGEDKEAENYHKSLLSNSGFNNSANIRKNISEKYKTIQRDFKAPPLNSPASVFECPLDKEETESAVKACKHNKASGKSQIPAEALQKGGPLLIQCLHQLYCTWWDLGVTPDSMQEALVTPLFKKGDKTDPKNYRPISLLNTIFKTYEKILEKRLRAYVENNNLLTPLQTGARANKGTTEAIFQILSATQHNTGNKTPTFLTLLDLSKAYDRVWRTGLWVKLHSLGIKGNLLRAIHSTYSNPSFTIKIGDHTSDTLPCENGLRQGSVLSPLLFVILFSAVADHLDSARGVPLSHALPDLHLHCQMFVDDTILLTNNEQDIGHQFRLFNQFAQIWGSVLNIDKTMILSTENLKNHGEWLQALEMEDAPVKIARYLGLWISLGNSTWNQHFKKIITKAKKSFFYLHSKGLRNGHIEPNEALELFKILIIPKFTFCAEIITPSASVINKVNDFFALAAKHMLGIPMTASTQTVLWEANIPDFSLQLDMAKLRFHRKLLVGENIAQSKNLYRKGNYLFDGNQKVLQKWDGALSTHNAQWKNLFASPHKPSKPIWKSLLNKALSTLRTSVFRTKHPSFFNLKPRQGICDAIFNLNVLAQKVILRARHNIDVQKQCPYPHCKRSWAYSSSKHYLTECLRPEVISSRVGLTLSLLNVSTADISHFTSNDLNDTFLGKPIDAIPTKHLSAIFKAAASHLIKFTPPDEFDTDWYAKI